MRKLATTFCLAALCSFAAQAQSGLGLVQPDAGLVFGIEWRKIVASPVGGILTEQIKKGLPPAPEAQALQDMLLNDVESVVVASSAAALNKAAGQPPVLVVVKGRFKTDLLKGLVPKGVGVEKYRGVDLIEGPRAASAQGAKAGAEQRVAFLDESTILAGDRAELRAAIDRIKAGKLGAPGRGILAGVGPLSADNQVWMIVEIPAGALKEAPPAAAQLFAGVKSTELGIAFGEGFGLHINVLAKDDASAQTMAQGLQGLLALGAMSQSQSPAAMEMMKKITITSESTRVKMALDLSRTEVEKLITEVQSAKPAAAPKAAAAPAPAPETSGPKTIRITGLDSGPIEVPAPEKK
jgi:hypothetical protein